MLITTDQARNRQRPFRLRRVRSWRDNAAIARGGTDVAANNLADPAERIAPCEELINRLSGGDCLAIAIKPAAWSGSPIVWA